METHDNRDESQDKHAIRIGIMCKGTTFEEWQARCLDNLLALDGVQAVLLIIDDAKADSPTVFDKIRNILSNPGGILFLLYMRFICRPRAQHRVDMAKFFLGVPSIDCKVIKKGKFSQYLSETDIETIHGYSLDFILKFGFGIIRGEILKLARYGIWSFHHDDEERYRGLPPCFWEIYNGDSVTGAILQRLTERLDGGIVLKKGFWSTEKGSYAKNIDQSYYESARWPAQVCIDIRNGTTDYIDAPPSQTKAPIHYAPNNLQVLSFLIKTLRYRLTSKWRALFRHEQWNIGIGYESIDTFLKPDHKPKIHWFPTPKRSKFLADPFGIVKNGKITVLCEDFDYGPGKGIISSIELIDKAASYRCKPAMDSPYHMSYPYLFEHQGEIYCTPETHQAREISLYKAQEFPYSWIKIGTLIQNIAGVDPTVFPYEGHWWLTCTDQEQGPDSNLFIWYAPDPLGPWKPHASNPVKTDVRSARPAGTPFIYNGNLYRPAQDCSRTYGGRIVLNRVIRLTPTEFKEESAGVIEPYTNSPFPHGLHTISSIGNFTLVDGKRWIFVPSAAKHTLTAWVSRKLRHKRWLWPLGYRRRNV